jgi:hypothetical protein
MLAMTIGDAAQVAVALIALGVALYAIQRDRADLRVREGDTAAGTTYLRVVNVGIRPSEWSVSSLKKAGAGDGATTITHRRPA